MLLHIVFPDLLACVVLQTELTPFLAPVWILLIIPELYCPSQFTFSLLQHIHIQRTDIKLRKSLAILEEILFVGTNFNL
jgi:hypothetical protein